MQGPSVPKDLQGLLSGLGGLSCYRTDFEACARLWRAWLERHPELCTMYIPRSVVKWLMQNISTHDVTIPTNLYGIGLDACRRG